MSKKLKFGLCCWNYWGDTVVDRPDATDEMVVSHIVKHLVDNGMCKDDLIWDLQHRESNDVEFFAEARELREDAYRHLAPCAHDWCTPPDDLDYVFCRWRWDVGMKDDPRLVAQEEMLKKYLGTKTTILLWDEDFKLLPEEETRLRSAGNVRFLETSELAWERSRPGWEYVPHPIALDVDRAVSNVRPRAGSGAGDHLDPSLVCAYVGNNYERDDCIEKYVVPLSRDFGGVHFYGNWLKYDHDIMSRWENVNFHTKVDRNMRDWVYSHASCVPMLAKDVYFERGHITPRLHEVVSVGSIPICFAEFYGHGRYFGRENVATDEMSFFDIVTRIHQYSYEDRKKHHRDQIDRLVSNRIFDVNEFFRVLDL